MYEREKGGLHKANRVRAFLVHAKRKLGMDKKMVENLENIDAEFEKRTSGVRYEWSLADFMALLKLAEYDYLGKTKAIIYAFKVGYAAGREEIVNE